MNQLNVEFEMTIICGTDFSVHSTHAANVAAALSAKRDTPFKLVHAVAPAQVEFLSEPHVNYLRDKLRRKLVAEGNRLRKLGADVVEKLVLGKPHEVLANSAQHFKANLIVVSTIGQIAPSRWLVGSVAERTAQISTVPTLVVRDHDRLVDWAKGKRALNVFIGYDFSESADAALRWVLSLAKIGPCNLTVTYLSWPPSETWRLGIGDCRSNGANSPEVHALLERDLGERCREILGKTKARINVVSGWGRKETHLLELAKANEADLIVVGTNQRRGLNRIWLGSVSRGILHHASTNVACVPLADEANTPREDIPAFSRVLVPTDVSKLGNKAIAFAYGAAQRGGEVSLVHVIPPVGGFKPSAEGTDGPRAKRRRNLVARLEAGGAGSSERPRPRNPDPG
jgi:nucleotide-binding universal stress UspA family protein